MKKVLITGGAGFVGYFLARRLLEVGNVEVTILDNLQRGRKDEELDSLLSKENITFDNGDLHSLDKIQPDKVLKLHLQKVLGLDFLEHF